MLKASKHEAPLKIADTDTGRSIRAQIQHLSRLLDPYRSGRKGEGKRSWSIVRSYVSAVAPEQRARRSPR